MPSPTSWTPAVPLSTERLSLEPLRTDHADEMFDVLDDPGLHTYIGGDPASREELGDLYARQVVGSSPDGTQGWLNWVLRRHDTGRAVGTVQATLTHGPDGGREAELAWVVAGDEQGRGYAREAAVTVAAWLREDGVGTLVAHVHPDHDASAGVARAVGMRPTGTVVDGEVRWTT